MLSINCDDNRPSGVGLLLITGEDDTAGTISMTIPFFGLVVLAIGGVEGDADEDDLDRFSSPATISCR
jgi:hypothetical protein